MDILLFGAAWSLLLIWMLVEQRNFLLKKQHSKGIDRVGSPFGGLMPLVIAGLLLGLSLAWLGVFKSLAIISLAILAGWAMHKLKKIDEDRYISQSAVPSSEVHS